MRKCCFFLIFLYCLVGLTQAQNATHPYCSGTVVLRNSTGTITDHYGFGNYQPNSQCMWIIAPTEQADSITFWVKKLDTEYFYDGVAVFDTSSDNLIWWTGTEVPSRNSTFEIPRAIVFFQSDEYINGEGFELMYFASSCLNRCSGNGVCVNKVCDCNEGWSGTDCSIGHCANECSAPQGECINNTCICKPGYYGDDCSDPYCEGQTILTAPAGSFSDHLGGGEYLNSHQCSWLIKAPPGDSKYDSITLYFTRFDVEEEFDHVAVFDGNSTSAHQIAYITGPTNHIAPILATSGEMLIVFVTDPGIARTGFDVNYIASHCPNQCSNHGACLNGTCFCDVGFIGTDCSQHTCAKNCYGRGQCVDNECECDGPYYGIDCGLCSGSACDIDQCKGDVELSAASGRIASHTGLGNYQANAQCQWTIKLDPNEFDSISLQFTTFDLEFDEAEVEIWDNDILVGLFTGEENPPPVFAYSGTMIVKFRSSQAPTREGFDAIYSGQSCPNHCIDRAHGVCQVGECLCNIGFTGVDCAQPTCGRNCSGNGICYNNICMCDLGYFGPDCSITHCSGTKILNARSGEFADHIHGHEYLPDSHCNFTIQPQGQPSPITLFFHNFSTESGRDWVTVYDGVDYHHRNWTSWSQALIRASGSWTPLPIISSSNTTGLVIRFDSDNQTQFTGFDAVYSTADQCPDSCNNQGYCINKTCHCFGPYSGESCANAADVIQMVDKGYYTANVADLSWVIFEYEVTHNVSDIDVLLDYESFVTAYDSYLLLFVQQGSPPALHAHQFYFSDFWLAKKIVRVKSPTVGKWYFGVYGYRGSPFHFSLSVTRLDTYDPATEPALSGYWLFLLIVLAVLVVALVTLAWNLHQRWRRAWRGPNRVPVEPERLPENDPAAYPSPSTANDEEL